MRRAIILASILFVSCDNSEKKTDGALEFRDAEGNQVSEDELLSSGEGTFDFEMKGGKAIPARAQELHNQARNLGAGGKYSEAIKLLDEAASLAPTWPYPPYDAAFTHLLSGDSTKALESYRKADSLAPKGFFTTKTAVYALEQEASKKIPQGTYLKYVSLEWADSVASKKAALDAILQTAPNFPPALKEQALAIDDHQKRLEALDLAISHSPDLETLGLLVVNRAATLTQLGRTDDAVDALKQLIDDPSATNASIEMATLTLKSIQSAP